MGYPPLSPKKHFGTFQSLPQDFLFFSPPVIYNINRQSVWWGGGGGNAFSKEKLGCQRWEKWERGFVAARRLGGGVEGGLWRRGDQWVCVCGGGGRGGGRRDEGKARQDEVSSARLGGAGQDEEERGEWGGGQGGEAEWEEGSYESDELLVTCPPDNLRSSCIGLHKPQY